MNTLFQETAHRFHQTTLSNSSGACYVIGHILTQYFETLGYNARKVTGKLCLVNTKGKYFTYGHSKIKKSILIGHYHTWCEVELEDTKWIIDPSIKANKRFLRKSHNIKLDKGIHDTIITTEPITYKWKYIEDSKLTHLSEEWLSGVSEEFIHEHIDILKGQKAA